jgi:hypothetical protein
MRSAAASPEGTCEVFLFLRSDAVFEAPAFVAGFDNVTMVSEAVKQCCCHLGITEGRSPKVRLLDRNKRASVCKLIRGKASSLVERPRPQKFIFRAGC